MLKSIKSIIIDDEPLVRDDLRYMLIRHPNIDIIGEAGTVPKARELLSRHRPDVVGRPIP